MNFFSDSQLALQKRYKGEKVAQRLLERRVQRELSPTDKDFIESVRFFFLASGTADTIDCSIKCGKPGFVRPLSSTEIVWPDYDGNRMYRTLGNIEEQPRVSLLFVDFDNPVKKGTSKRTTRLRIIGNAIIDETPEVVHDFLGASRVVRMQIEYVFPNCPRYLPSLKFCEESIYTPRPGHKAPTPEWKTRGYIKEVLDEEE